MGCASDAAFELVVAAHGKLPRAVARMTPMEAEVLKARMIEEPTTSHVGPLG